MSSPALGEVRALLERARHHDQIVTLAVPSPARALEPCARDLFWASPRGLTIAGFGAAAMITGSGERRFAEVRARGAELFRRVRVIALGEGPPRPRLIGGFSFLPRAPEPPWHAFGAASFVLPRLAHVEERGRTWVCLSIAASELAAAGAEDRVVAELAHALEPARATPPLAARSSSWPSAAAHDPEFVALVQAIQDGIAAGRFSKVVAARSRTLELAQPIDLGRVLTELGRRAAACMRFAFVRSGSSFVGATPERLLEKRGAKLRSEALAGTAKSGDGRALAALLASDKERNEHLIVRDEIVRCLSALGRVEYPPEPELYALRHVTHLRTPIAAELARDCHLLEIAERLHPTSAVGGQPRQSALEFLARHERIERGWYAAPVGWFDAQGDGELAVALRAGLFESERAHLFAGAGIVQGSLAEQELCETELKLAALREVVELR